jgi:hypothetical protein
MMLMLVDGFAPSVRQPCPRRGSVARVHMYTAIPTTNQRCALVVTDDKRDGRYNKYVGNGLAKLNDHFLLLFFLLCDLIDLMSCFHDFENLLSKQ